MKKVFFAALAAMTAMVIMPYAHADTLQYTFTEGGMVTVFDLDQHPVANSPTSVDFGITPVTFYTGGSQLIGTIQFALPGQGFCLLAFVNIGFGPCDYSSNVYFTGGTANPTLLTGNYFFIDNFGGMAANVVVTDISSTPEPSSIVLLSTGLLGVAGAVRRRFRSNGMQNEG